MNRGKHEIHWWARVEIWNLIKLHEFPLATKVEQLVFAKDGGSVNI